MLTERRSHTVSIPRAHEAGAILKPASPSPKVIAQQWIKKLEDVLASNDMSRLGTVMVQDCWWRDMLTFDWDLRTIQGLDKLTDYLGQNVARSQLSNFRLRETGKFQPCVQNPVEGVEWIESMFDFDTRVAHGSGVFRLVPGSEGSWKGFMMYTAIKDLKNFEETNGWNRPHGGNNSLVDGAIKGNWQERRQRQIDFLDEEPKVLIIGAGQAGLNMGARLQQLGLSALIIDKNQRIGDNWRNRYRTLVTHDPVQYTHMAYLPFPTNWPLFTAKDKIGDWFEAYASIMELNVWMSSTIDSAEYNDEKRTWTVQVERSDGSIRKLHTNHIVFCTGHASQPKIPLFPGQDKFEGEAYHGSRHQDASFSGDVKGQKVVVVGTGNSGHDIAQNFFESGANVTMVQRRPTYVISAKTGLFMLHEGLYDEGGPPTEDADVYGQSMPIPVQFALNVGLTQRIAAAEKQNLEGLAKAGFEVTLGDDGSGLYRKYVTRGGGYYIDVGCSQLIIDGKIKIKQSPHGIKGFEPHALVLADGTKLDADIVVLATGYDNMRTSARKVLGDKVADRCKDVWDLDEEGEVNAMWRNSGHPGFWFMGGSLALCRTYSKFLALQIKGIQEGLYSQ
ncbi:MAG: hypothetical protein M1827_005115 [Pycnora praestabilis]|nr:MAG: hypothetical protein M1827_005115 [Pycnora praestabilis]